MKIEKLMSRPVRACAASDSLATAAMQMWEGDCGLIPVVDVQGRPLGVVTDRDVCMAALFEGGGLADIPVSRVMSRELQIVDAGSSVHDALECMRTHQLRRLPVVDDERRLVGMLTLADVAGLFGRREEIDQRELRADDVALTLASICRQRREEPTAVMIVEVTPRARTQAEAGEEGRPARKPRAARGTRTRSKSKKA